jgi:hypothetical protein
MKPCSELQKHLKKRVIFLLFFLNAWCQTETAQSALSTNLAPRWISLYEGQETRMSSRDREKIKDLLNAFSVDFKIQPEGIIQVRASERSVIQSLISKFWSKHRQEEQL